MAEKILCPCCGKHYFEYDGDFTYCNECGWQNDDLQNGKPDFWGGANDMSLNQARKAYKKGLPID